MWIYVDLVVLKCPPWFSLLTVGWEDAPQMQVVGAEASREWELQERTVRRGVGALQSGYHWIREVRWVCVLFSSVNCRLVLFVKSSSSYGRLLGYSWFTIICISLPPYTILCEWQDSIWSLGEHFLPVQVRRAQRTWAFSTPTGPPATSRMETAASVWRTATCTFSQAFFPVSLLVHMSLYVELVSLSLSLVTICVKPVC